MKLFSLLTAVLLSSASVSSTPLDVRQVVSSSIVGSPSAISTACSCPAAATSTASSASSAAASATPSTPVVANGTIINSYNSTLSYNSTESFEDPSVYGVSAAGFADVHKAKVPLNIVLTNDDSWASANIRALYYALRRAGHRVLMVAPAANQSGQGGTVVLPTELNLTSAGRGGFVPVGSPYAGLNVTDPGLRYLDATPAACSGWALDHDAQYFFNATRKNDSTAGVDLVLSGPNEGTNLGIAFYTGSGTLGASYFAVGRNVPSIAFSASTNVRQYTALNLSDPADESVKLATYSSNFVTALSDNAKSSNSSARIMPLGIGLTVNYPKIAPTGSCTNLTWTHTRMTGKGLAVRLVVNATTGLPTYAFFGSDGINVCNAGNCSLPGETEVISNGKCQASASIYSVDYDAPTFRTQNTIAALTSSIQSLNGNSNSSNSTA
ncbi:acid phosphatase [Pseudozyma hubeiensis SY62]|uniref:Acid phosphatase n=1 Tax=Pseudozyma hubeiensis (strain SY62) TaxID=1305764 RepID=R9NZA4_PSEHS|nr:acid phosphatase [Pseudozyma hubeiensis SY62]GAC94183.1 acid phosphatase [Pseudozyma hubeiensis SY62]